MEELIVGNVMFYKNNVIVKQFCVESLEVR